MRKLVLGFLMMFGAACGNAGKAWKACELGKLPAMGQVGWATAQDVVSNPGSTVSDLESAGLKLLPGQLECGAVALLAWLEGLAKPDAGEGASIQQALYTADTDVAHEHAKQVLRAYLQKHPATSCGDRPVL